MPPKTPHVSDVLAEVFRRGGMKRAVARAEAVLLWPQVAGTKLARFTEARSLQEGVLFVEVTDSETAMHLTLERQRFLDVYRGKFRVTTIRDIRFRAGRPTRPPEPEGPPPRPTQVDARALAALAEGLGALPEALAKPALKAARSLLAYREQRRAEGWTPCAVCGSLWHSPSLCETCRRYAQEPRVVRAGESLAAAPHTATPLLSDEERAVAIHLAKSGLMDRLRELLPHVLADPTHKHELETVARCYVAHELGKPLADVGDADLDVLEHRVARALGRWR